MDRSKEEIEKMIAKNVPLATIAKYYGVSTATIRNDCIKWDIKRHRERANDIPIEDLVNMRNVDIVKKYNVSAAFVCKLKKKHGIAPKEKRKHAVEEAQGEEEWRDIRGYEGKYQVSNLGRIRSEERTVNGRLYEGKIMRQVVRFTSGQKPCGTAVFLRDGIRNQQSCSVAKLVLLAFRGDPPACAKQVKHLDGNPLNNKLDNLAWDVTANYYLPVNEKNRAVFEEWAYRCIKWWVKTRGLWNLELGYYSIDDLIQDCAFEIWKDIDGWQEDKVPFLTFCTSRCRTVFSSIYGKIARRNELCKMQEYDDAIAYSPEEIEF